MKYFLVILLGITTISYAKIDKDIESMLPKDRYNLSVSMFEVGEYYENKGQKKKAKRYFETALQVYPVRDQGNKVAQKLGVTLDEKKIYQEFIQTGDLFFQQKEYKKALVNYLMANEVTVSVALYQKISETYSALGDMENARIYQDLCEKQLSADDKSSSAMVDGTMMNQILQEDYENINN